MKALILLLLVSFAHAAPLDEFPCASELTKLATEWKASPHWVKQSQGGSDKAFLASSSAIGEWVLVMKIPDGSVISKTSQSGRIEVVMKTPKCEKETKSYPHPKIAADVVGDSAIKTFIDKNKTGAIYVWSPRMTLSQDGITEIQKAAKAKKLPVMILMDKDVSQAELVKLKKKLGDVVTRKVDSLEFKMRNVGQHYPALMVFKDSKILPGIKYGYEKSDRYQLDLTDMLGTGK